MERFLALACAVASLLGATPALADWEYTHWGMTPAQVIAASSGAVKPIPKAEITRDDDDHWEITQRGSFKDGAMTLSAGFMFDTKTGGLRCVLYNAMGADAEAVRLDLVRKYGPGKESSFGPTRSIAWAKPDQIDFSAGQTPVAAAVMHCRPGG